jgi:hypothetical protein
MLYITNTGVAQTKDNRSEIILCGFFKMSNIGYANIIYTVYVYAGCGQLLNTEILNVCRIS